MLFFLFVSIVIVITAIVVKKEIKDLHQIHECTYLLLYICVTRYPRANLSKPHRVYKIRTKKDRTLVSKLLILFKPQTKIS